MRGSRGTGIRLLSRIAVLLRSRSPRWPVEARKVHAVKVNGALKTTRYFEEQVLRKRPYIQRAWCEKVLAAPLRREVQSDGRVRFWGRISRPGEAGPRFLRVVILEDGETVHTAFFDRNFREDRP